ncbi:hypothetical protein BVI2075_780101 [Burkholderia vietnamiensis]|nr:hypothetical protein BVI2075_780101 [Burkholderia vietnamiensis]
MPRLAVDDNTFVHRGDVLVEIDPRDYRARVDAARAQLGLAQAQLDAARVQLDIARVQYPAQYRQARAQIESADAAYRQARPLPQGAVAVSGRARRGAAMVGGAATGGAGRVADDDGSRRAVQGARRRVADVGYGGGCEDGGCGVERCGAERCGVAVTRRHISRVSIARGPHRHARENSSESASLKRMRTGSA